MVELSLKPKTVKKSWVLYIDGSSNAKGTKANIILEGPGGL